MGSIQTVTGRHLQSRGVSAIETTLQDIAFSWRGLRRSPLFTLVGVITLALTTGAVATVLTMAFTFFLRSLPVSNPDELVVVSATRDQGSRTGFVSYPDYQHFREQTRSLEALAAHYSTAPFFVVGQGLAKEINGAVVSSNLFPVLGLEPFLGRFFRPEEDGTPDRYPVAVIGHEMWRRAFRASPSAVGSVLKINGTAFTVVGVLPETFRGMYNQPSQIYIPTMMLRVGYRWCRDSLAVDCTVLSMVGRLEEGRSLEEARAEMKSLKPLHWNDSDAENTGVAVDRLAGARAGDSETRLVRLLLLVSVVLLLVSCVNLSGLLMARGAARVREFAIRASLGAARIRIVRQWMTEAVLLALIGGTLGTLLSLALTQAIRMKFYSLDGAGRPLFYDFTLEPGVMWTMLLVSVLGGCLLGILPAMKWSRVRISSGPRQPGRAVSGRLKGGSWLVGFQAATAVALSAIAVLLMTSAGTLAAGTNFDPTHVALLRLRPRLIQYPPERAQGFHREVVRRLENLPGVESLSMIGTGVALFGLGTEVWLPEWPDRDQRALPTGYSEIGTRYFETLRVALVGGREFVEDDNLDSPRVAVVNETLAGRLWPRGQAIGSTLELESGPHQVVGVVQNISLRSRIQPPVPHVYVPFWQNPGQVDARLCVRVQGDPGGMLALLSREVNQVDPEVPIANLTTLSQQIAGIFQPLRVSATFVAYAAGLAVLLSAIGLYGTQAFAVARRTREIGIRIAVGAGPSGILRMILREGLAPIFLGMVPGLGLAVAGTGIVGHLLVAAASMDLLSYAGAGLIVLATGLIAALAPALRAARLEPLVALRDE